MRDEEAIVDGGVARAPAPIVIKTAGALCSNRACVA